MPKTIVTHDTSFHADDVFAVAVMTLLFPDSKIVRSRDRAVIDSADIAVDAGGVYDAPKMRFDHHQTEGAGKRANGIPYASFGLVWKEYGEKLCGSAEAAEIIDRTMVIPIDAIDNGFDISSPLFEGIKDYSIRDYFYSFLGRNPTPEQIDGTFMKVVRLAAELLEREIAQAKAEVEDWARVRDIYEKAPDKSIIVLPEEISWKKVLIPSEAIYTVRPRSDGKWGARAIPDKLNNFSVKKPFPKEWGGLRDDELVRVTGVEDAVFCHSGLWLAVAKTEEGALELARKALNA